MSLREQLHLKEFKIMSVLDRTKDDARFEETEISDSDSIEDERHIRHEDCGGCYD
jgi:hypothetical protein